MASDASVPDAGLDAAQVGVRRAGHCVLCDRLVELTAEGACGVRADHPRAAISGRITLAPDEPLPCLPRFNIAAFLIPPIWGPANGQWAGAILLPIWLFADSVLASAAAGGALLAGGAGVVVLATVAAQAWFGKRANGLTWRRASDRMGIDEFARRQRVWAMVAVPLWLLMLGWAVFYRLRNPF